MESSVNRTSSDDPHPDPPPSVEAEHAAIAFWREAAEAHRSDLQALRRRPIVRAALRADRALQPFIVPTKRAVKAASAVAEQLEVTAGGIRSWSARTRRRRNLRSTVAQLPPATGRARLGWPADTTIFVIDDDGDRTGIGAVAGADRCIAEARTEFVCIRRAGLEPVDPNWLDRLREAMSDGVAAATAHAVHPARRPWRATSHDLLTRELGIAIEDVEGVPTPVAVAAGERVRVDSGPIEVKACSASAVLLRRTSVLAAGGLPHGISDIDAAVAELCVRLSAAGERVVAVDSALVTDHRPVVSRERLLEPIDPRSPSWRRVVERHGASLLSSGPVSSGCRPEHTHRVAITTAVPSAKLVDQWGDWHFAEGLARSLRTQGHEVVLQTADRANDLVGRACDLHLVLRGLNPVRRTAGQTHVLWVVSHPESLTVSECDEADLVCVASERFAQQLRRRTKTPVVVMLQATDPHRFQPVPPDTVHEHAVTVVAKSRERLRDSVRTALDAGIRPAIYGSGWERLVDPDLIVAEHVPNDELPRVYCSAGVVLNDHWGTMRASGFVSNRLFDVLACGAPVVSDHLPEIEEIFGDTVPTYSGAADLRSIVADALDHPDEARARAARGREIVLASHTFDHRTTELLDHVNQLRRRPCEPGRSDV
jgi:glycosyltransferase involved in cell wall biosynthesis